MAGKGEVVVKMVAAALNFFDTLIIQGKYQYKPDIAVFAGMRNFPARSIPSARA